MVEDKKQFLKHDGKTHRAMNKTYRHPSYKDCYWIPIWQAVTVKVASWKRVSAVNSAKHLIYIMDSISSNSLILPEIIVLVFQQVYLQSGPLIPYPERSGI